MIRNPKALIITIIVSIILAAIPAWAYYTSQEQLIKRLQQKELKTAIGITKSEIESASNKAAILSANVSGSTAIAEALRAGDKNALAKNLSSVFNASAAKYDLQEAQFVTPPAISFLRLIDTNANSNATAEDLSSFREMVVGAIQRKEALKGLEVGRKGLSIRAIDPIKDSQGLVGAFEVGLSFDSILDNIKKSTGFDAAIYVDDELMKKVATQAKAKDSEYVIGEYRNIASTDSEVMKSLVNADLLSDTHSEFTKVQDIKNVQYGVASVPLMDFKGNNIGTIIIAGNFSDYQKDQHYAAAWICLFFVLQSILFVTMVVAIVNSFFPHPEFIKNEKVNVV